ncbi:inositol monophosphatase family protein [Marinomonas epiphytica]
MQATKNIYLIDAVKEVGLLAQTLRQEGLEVTVKGRQDFVSQADIKVEKLLKERILERYPEDAILGEESGLSLLSEGQGIWVIDPIDGTTNYMQGMDYWCISVAYWVSGQVQEAYVYAPDKNEFYHAKKGQGAYLNGQVLSVKEPEQGQAIIGLGRSNRRPLDWYLQTLSVLDRNNIEYRRFGAGALMLAQVAAGYVHGYFEAHLNSWDALAGLLIIEEAGGKVSAFIQQAEQLTEGNYVWAATPDLWQSIHPKLQALT